MYASKKINLERSNSVIWRIFNKSNNENKRKQVFVCFGDYSVVIPLNLEIEKWMRSTSSTTRKKQINNIMLFRLTQGRVVTFTIVSSTELMAGNISFRSL